MPRQPRIEYEGAIYHVMSRGDRREAIVSGDEDRNLFVDTLAEACAKTDWQVHAYCLMSNHFHVVVETPKANLASGMKWFLGTYTIRYNARHRLQGHLFAGRYKSLVIDERDAHYLRVACDYVHLNPARAGLIGAEGKLAAYRWSSYPAYLKAKDKRPGWLRADRVFGEHGIRRDDNRGRLEFSRRMEFLRKEPGPKENETLRRGWQMGAEDFVSHLLDRIEGKMPEDCRARERTETDEEKAERIVDEEMRRIGMTEHDILHARKGTAWKVGVARRLRKETTVTLKWIAQRLNMGTWTHVSHLLYHDKT